MDDRSVQGASTVAADPKQAAAGGAREVRAARTRNTTARGPFVAVSHACPSAVKRVYATMGTWSLRSVALHNPVTKSRGTAVQPSVPARHQLQPRPPQLLTARRPRCTRCAVAWVRVQPSQVPEALLAPLMCSVRGAATILVLRCVANPFFVSHRSRPTRRARQTQGQLVRFATCCCVPSHCRPLCAAACNSNAVLERWNMAAV